jgi:hypothetical protein
MGTYYKKVEDYLDRIDSGCWIEVGVDRGEGSTKFLSDLAGARGVDFHGVDMDPDQIARATENLSVDGKLPDYVTLACDREKTTFSNCQLIIQNYKPAWYTWITLTGTTGWAVKKKHLLLALNRTIVTSWGSK